MHSEYNIRTLYYGLRSTLMGRAFTVLNYMLTQNGFTCTVRYVRGGVDVPVKIEWSDPATISVSVNGEEPLRHELETDADGNITYDGMSSLATNIARGVLKVDRGAAEPAASQLDATPCFPILLRMLQLLLSANDKRPEFDDETIRILRDIMAVLQKATR